MAAIGKDSMSLYVENNNSVGWELIDLIAHKVEIGLKEKYLYIYVALTFSA